MPLILHLSDLHLGNQPFDDYKSECVPLKERNNRIQLLTNTLEELDNHLRESDTRLDAVVVSGDITVANNVAGFEQLSSLLSRLGGSLPAADRVVVTPGNHDVTWRTNPSTSERYENFSRYIRGKGYVTPLLDGLDIDSNGERISSSDPILLSPDLAWMVVAINSSNYSGSLEPLTDIPESIWDQVPDLLASRGLDRAKVERVLDQLRLRDIARVSPQQLGALHRTLRELDLKIESAGKDARQTLKIAVLHHHLLPVSPAEEFKAFESITNLGQVHQFLRSNSFDIVLHGHKHIGNVYRNHIYDATQSSNYSHPLLVISGSTIGGQDHREAEVARLVDLQARPYSPRVRIRRLPALRPGSHFPTPDWESHRLWPRQRTLQLPASNEVIEGESCSEVYACVLALFEDLPVNKELHNIVCVVHDPFTARSLPDTYPTVSGVAAEHRERWFNELIEWWQREQSSVTKPVFFTHGSRIYRFGGDCNQFQRAVELLRRKTDTSRSIIILVDPRSDNQVDNNRKFPAFSLIQMAIRPGGPQRFELDCIGYFRKQEMRYWWPVNIAELATIQRRAHEQLAGDVRGLTLGTLTTIAAISYAGTTPPKVAIPALDREFDDHPERLWSMAYALFWPEMPGRSEIGKTWKHVLEDLVPPETPDPDGVPMSVDGLRFLADQVSRFAVHHAESSASALVRYLNELHKINERQSDESDPTTSHARWRASVKEYVDMIIPIVDELFR